MAHDDKVLNHSGWKCRAREDVEGITCENGEDVIKMNSEGQSLADLGGVLVESRTKDQEVVIKHDNTKSQDAQVTPGSPNSNFGEGQIETVIERGEF